MEKNTDSAIDPAIQDFTVFAARVTRLLADNDVPVDRELVEEGVIELSLQEPEGVSFALSVDGSKHCRTILTRDGYELGQKVSEFDESEDLADWISTIHETAG